MASSSLRQKIKEFILTNVDDLRNLLFWVEIFVEFILCTILLTVIIFALTTLKESAYKPSTTHFGLFAAFVNVALIEGYGPMCGSPMNPAAAWGFFIAGRISLVRAVMYMVAEIGGAATGAMIGISLTPAPQVLDFQPISPGPGVSVGTGIAIEGILTFNLMVVALSCTNPKAKTPIMPSIPIAFWVGTSILAAPVYWGGPFIGATVGAIFYSLVTEARKCLDRHRVSHQPEQEDDRSILEKNCNSEACFPVDGQIAIHM